MKEFIRSQFCRNNEEVEAAINEYTKTLDEIKCQKYIQHLKKVQLKKLHDCFKMIYKTNLLQAIIFTIANEGKFTGIQLI